MSAFLSREPRPELRGWVERLWWYAGEATGEEIAVPTGQSQLLINLVDGWIHGEQGDGPTAIHGPLIAAPRSRPTTLLRRDQERIVGVVFRTGGLYRWVGGAVGELAERDVALSELWSGAERLHARLLAAPTPAGCLEALEQELLAVELAPTDPRVLRAAASVVGGTVAAAAAEVGLSERRLSALFTGQVGLGPRRWARVRRLQAALPRVARTRDLSQVAVECGYFDQAHLTREFRELAGTTPGAYRALRLEHANHLPPARR